MEIQPVIDFSRYVKDKTQDFTRREWVFKDVDDWLGKQDGPRFFLLTGEPGCGKSAIAARLYQFSQGEVPLLNGLPHLTPPFLSAIHFCSRREVRWINPHVFSESLALQLAARYPAFAKALAEKSGERRIIMEVEQKVEKVEGGQVVGIMIRKLDVSGISPEDAFVRVVREPLEALLGQERDLQVLILVDSLDEALEYSGKVSIVSLLSRSEQLPAGVRFILTSRPETEVLRPLRRFPLKECSLTSPEGVRQSCEDVKQHVIRTLKEHPALAAKLAPEISPQEFIAVVCDRSAGNFLYVKYLLDMLQAPERKKITRKSLEELPSGLDGIYLEFMEKFKGGWAKKYGPLFGTLAVAQEPLSESQLGGFIRRGLPEVRTMLPELRQFLDADESVPASQRLYTIYHRSLGDFMLDQDRSEEFWCEKVAQHNRIVRYYLETFRKGRGKSWDEVSWDKVDDYGLRHLAMHLYVLRDDPASRTELYNLMCRPFMREKRARTFSQATFAKDVDLAIEAAAADDSIAGLVQLIRLCLLYATLGSLATEVPRELLEVLVQLGQNERALAYADLINDRERQWQAYCLIGEALRAIGDSEKAKIALYQALSVIENIQDGWNIGHALIKVALSLAEVGDRTGFDRALAVAGAIQDIGERADALNKIAKALAQVGDQKKAKETANLALAVADTIQDEEIKANTLSRVAQILSQVGDQQKATETVNLAMTTAETIKDERVKTRTLDEVAQSFALVGETDRALDVVGMITDEEAKALSLCRVFGALAEEGDQNNAIKALTRALAVASTLSNSYPMFSALIKVPKAMCKMGDPERAIEAVHEALSIAKLIQNERKKLDALKMIAWNLNMVGDQKVVKEAANGILGVIGTIPEKTEDDDSKAECLGEVALALAEVGDQKKAKEIVNLAWALAKTIPIEWQNKISALIKVAQTLIKTGDPDQALVVADSIQVGKDKVFVLSEVARFLVRSGNQKKSIEVANRALAATESISYEYSKVDSLIKIAQALARNKDLRRALLVAQAIPDKTKIDWAMISVAQVLAQQGDLERALMVAEATPDKTQIDGALNSVARALAVIGETDQALAVIENIQDAYKKADALSAVAAALVQVGDKKRASEVANQALAVAEMISDAEKKAWVLTSLVWALVKEGELNKGTEVANQALAMTEMIPSKREKEDALSRVAQALAQVGDLERALAVTEMINPFNKANALREVSWALASVGDLERALSVAETLLSGELGQGPALKAVVQAIAQGGDVNRALALAGTIQHEYWKGQALCEVAKILTKAGEQNTATEVANQAMALADGIEDINIKAQVMSGVGQALTKVGEQYKANQIMRKAFNLGRMCGRGFFFDILTEQMDLLEALYQGDTVWQVYEAIQKVDGWWDDLYSLPVVRMEDFSLL